uniref:(northern house mosquito) hypothetical protein n=1 Tax=Culex pipiens TaxID=7175 RepID=A0A8D8AIZ0_CULPI
MAKTKAKRLLAGSGATSVSTPRCESTSRRLSTTTKVLPSRKPTRKRWPLLTRTVRRFASSCRSTRRVWRTSGWRDRILIRRICWANWRRGKPNVRTSSKATAERRSARYGSRS